jgi:hypothetical protein
MEGIAYLKAIENMGMWQRASQTHVASNPRKDIAVLTSKFNSNEVKR